MRSGKEIEAAGVFARSGARTVRKYAFESGSHSEMTAVNRSPRAVLLTVLAAGIAAFGGYCFIWSRNARR